MKKITNFLIDYALFGLLILFLIYCIISMVKKADANPETHGIYFYSFTTGCYVAYEDECERLDGDRPREQCFQRGLDYCERAAMSFVEWIELTDVK